MFLPRAWKGYCRCYIFASDTTIGTPRATWLVKAAFDFGACTCHARLPFLRKRLRTGLDAPAVMSVSQVSYTEVVGSWIDFLGMVLRGKVDPVKAPSHHRVQYGGMGG